MSVPDSAACSSVGIFEGEYMLCMSDDEMCLREEERQKGLWGGVGYGWMDC